MKIERDGLMAKNKIVLAYSGGLDTSVAIQWMKEKYSAEIITATVDVGQGDDMTVIERKAKATGALKHYSIDAKKEFVENYVFASIKANALYEGKYPLSTAIGRPVIAAKLVEIARKENASVVAHGCSGRGNDQVRFDITIRALAPDIKIIAPIREWNLAREEEIKYAKAHGIPVPVTIEKPYSIDQSLWGRAIECGVLEDPFAEPPEEIFEWTSSVEKAPSEPTVVSLDFAEGVPVAVDGQKLDSVTLVLRLNEIAGKHGVGRIDHIEDRMVGIKSREVYECPAATVILEAHKDLEKTVLTRHELAFKERVDAEWTYLAYAGLWMDPLREDLEAFIDASQKGVNGKVKVKLHKGSLRVVGRTSPGSLYDKNLVSYNLEGTFDQRWAEGFIRAWGMPTEKARNLRTQMAKKAK
jgi:argininosuccinate synthase